MANNYVIKYRRGEKHLLQRRVEYDVEWEQRWVGSKIIDRLWANICGTITVGIVGFSYHKSWLNDTDENTDQQLIKLPATQCYNVFLIIGLADATTNADLATR